MANDKKNPLSGAFHDPEPPKDAEAAKDVVSAEMKIDISKLSRMDYLAMIKTAPALRRWLRTYAKTG